MDQSTMELLPCGARVGIGPGGDAIEGVVLAVTIREGVVSYQVAWWDGRSRHEEWVRDLEVTPRDACGPRCRVGFRGESPGTGLVPLMVRS